MALCFQFTRPNETEPTSRLVVEREWIAYLREQNLLDEHDCDIAVRTLELDEWSAPFDRLQWFGAYVALKHGDVTEETIRRYIADHPDKYDPPQVEALIEFLCKRFSYRAWYGY